MKSPKAPERISKVFRNDEGQMIGVFGEDGIFYKEVKKSIHLFRVMDAWGIEERVIDELRSLKCSGIHIFEKEEKKHYVIGFKIFDRNGVRRNFSTPQVFLQLSWFGNQLALPGWQTDGKTDSENES